MSINLVLQLRHFIGGLVGVIHRQIIIAIQDVFFGLYPQHDIFAHGQAFFEFRLLWQVANFRAFRRPGFAREICIQAGHNFEQG